MELVNDKGETISSKQEGLTQTEAVKVIEDLGNTKVAPESTMKTQKASERTRAHLNSPATINRTFPNMTEMEKQAEKVYAQHSNKIKDEVESDLKNGFDISNEECVNSFVINYTPMGNSYLVKEIFNEEVQENKIILPPGLDLNDKKYLIMVPGLLTSVLQRGDIVTLKGSPSGKIDAIDRKFNGVKFYEVDGYAVAGVYRSQDFMNKRIDEINAKVKASQ